MDDELYKQNILDRFRHPYHKRVPENFDIQEGGVNPACGDSLIFYLTFDKEGALQDISFDGEGCAISQAAADMLCGSILEKNPEEISALTKEDMNTLLGISVGRARERCILLPLDTVKSALKKQISNR